MTPNMSNNFCRTCGCHFPPDTSEAACRTWEECMQAQEQRIDAPSEKLCRHPLAIRPLLYSDTLNGEQVGRDDMWAVTTEELNALVSASEERWISPSEALPEDGEDVLIWHVLGDQARSPHAFDVACITKGKWFFPWDRGELNAGPQWVRCWKRLRKPDMASIASRSQK